MALAQEQQTLALAQEQRAQKVKFAFIPGPENSRTQSFHDNREIARASRRRRPSYHLPQRVSQSPRSSGQVFWLTAVLSPC